MQLLTERLFLIPLQPDGMRTLPALAQLFQHSPLHLPQLVP